MRPRVDLAGTHKRRHCGPERPCGRPAGPNECRECRRLSLADRPAVRGARRDLFVEAFLLPPFPAASAWTPTPKQFETVYFSSFRFLLNFDFGPACGVPQASG